MMDFISGTVSESRSNLRSRMGGWLVELQNLRYRKCMGWLILIGLAGFVGLMQTGISVQQPFLPLKTIQSHLANYVRSGSDDSETTNSPLSKSKSTPEPPSNDTKLPTKNGEKSHPRIAVCLVGGARKFELTGPSLLKYVLNMYNNTDVFLYAPFDKDSHKFHFLKNANSLAAVRIFSPLRIDVTTVHSEALTSNGSPNGLQGLLQYFNLVEGCLTMIKFYQIRYKVKYDWIVRTRVDGYWNGPLPPPQSYLNERYIVPQGSQFGGLNDSKNTSPSLNYIEFVSLFPHLIDRETYSLLERPVDKDEFLHTLKEMARGKSAGPDGWTIELFIHFQEIMFNEITDLVEDSRRLGRVSEAVNATFIALIPKSRVLESFSKFRPISLCNTIYKIISKTTTIQIKPLLSNFIYLEQFGFLEKRQIHNAVGIAQECIHSIKT